MNVIAFIVGQQPSEKSDSDLEPALLLVFGVLSVAGLMLITIADVDVNDFLRRNQRRMIAFVSVLLATIEAAGAGERWQAKKARYLRE